MGCEVAFCRVHLVNPSDHKFLQAYKWIWGEERGVTIVEGGIGRTDPVFEKYGIGLVPKGWICAEYRSGQA